MAAGTTSNTNAGTPAVFEELGSERGRLGKFKRSGTTVPGSRGLEPAPPGGLAGILATRQMGGEPPMRCRKACSTRGSYTTGGDWMGATLS